MLFGQKLFTSSIWPPRFQMRFQLCSQISPMPGRAKDTAWRREKAEAEQGHQQDCPELSRTAEVHMLALVTKTGGTGEAEEAAELDLHGWNRGFPGRRKWGRSRNGAGWVETPGGGERGREEEGAEGSAFLDQRDVEGIRSRMKTSRHKTEIGITDTLKKKYI